MIRAVTRISVFAALSTVPGLAVAHPGHGTAAGGTAAHALEHGLIAFAFVVLAIAAGSAARRLARGRGSRPGRGRGQV